MATQMSKIESGHVYMLRQGGVEGMVWIFTQERMDHRQKGAMRYCQLVCAVWLACQASF